MVFLLLAPKFFMKKKNNNSTDKLILHISKILEINKNELIKKNNFSKIDTYDSLKHLEIITAIDKIFGRKIKLTGDLSKLSSVKEILTFIKKNSN